MDNPEIILETDVLVIGGGIAGVFAAIKAREEKVSVTLVSKGNIGRSGQSPWAHGMMVVSPDAESQKAELMDRVSIGGEYVNNRDWTKLVLDESYARFQDLLAWGQPFLRDEKGDFLKQIRLNKEQPLRLWAPKDGPLSWIQPLKSQLKKRQVKVLEKVMIVDLIKQDGAVLGAIGIATDSWDIYVIQAKTTVICSGAGGFKPVGGWPISDLTADGQVMAYRAGAEITGKEFEDFHNGFVKREGGISFSLSVPWINAEGDEIDLRQGFNLGLDFEAHAGRAPIGKGKDEVFSNAALGMSVHTAEGIWPVDEHCASAVPGLYSAGDACASMVNGAKYVMGGSGIASACVTGARAGVAAAGQAKQTAIAKIDPEQLTRLIDTVRLPVRRQGGFSPNWVTALLKNIMTPYFILRIKRGDRLQATLTLVEFMRDHLSPLLFARDPHELRLAHETKNMITNAEMKLRASLFRNESRGTHYREDFPRRVDPDWLAWVLLKEENGMMQVIKKPVPKEWTPDLTVPYEARYPDRFPNE